MAQVLLRSLLLLSTLEQRLIAAEQSQSSDASCSVVQKCVTFDDSSNSILVKDTSGRLGNQLHTYLVLKALSLKFGYQTYTSRSVFAAIAQIFPGVDVPAAEDALCQFDQVYGAFKAEVRRRKMQKLHDMIESRLGKKVSLKMDVHGRWEVPPELVEETGPETYQRLVHSTDFNDIGDLSIDVESPSFPWEIYADKLIYDLAEPEYRMGRAIILYPGGYSPYLNETMFLYDAPGLEDQLVKDLTPSTEFLQLAEKTLWEIIRKHKEAKKSLKKKKKKSKKAKLTVVGIHCRMTDHRHYQAEKGLTSLRPSYFLQAMDMYREVYPDVIFVLISDDPKWATDNLAPRNKLGDLYIVNRASMTKIESVGHDLALMSLCNHTVISYGTFSFWSGFLAGGTVIKPEHFEEYRSHSSHPAVFKKHPLKHPLPRLYPI